MSPATGGPERRTPRRTRPPLFFGWAIVGAGTLNASVLMGLVFYGFGVFMEPITREFGWTAAAVAFGFSLQRMEAGLFAPVAGYLIDRYGPRRVGFVGVAIYGTAFIGFARIESLWEFYLVSVLIALGQSLGTFANFSASLMRWFQRLRARAVSFMMAGTGIGTLAVYPLVACVEHFGWRDTLLGMSVLIWIVGFSTVATLRVGPEPYGLRPDGEPPEPALRTSDGTREPDRDPTLQGISAAAAMRTASFWLLLVANVAFGFSNLGWVVLQFPALQAKGFSASLASSAVAAYGIASIATRLGLGWYADRMGRAHLFAASYAFMGAGLAVMAVAQSFTALLPYYLLFGLGHAGFVITSQTIVADYFGTYRFATIRGWLGTLSSLGGATGPIIGAWIFDSTGSYDWAFATFAATATLGLPAALLAEKFRPHLDVAS